MQWLERTAPSSLSDTSNPPLANTSTLYANPTTPLIAKLCASRGVNRLQELTLPLAKLPDPWLLLGMEAAATRVLQAIQQREKILIIADYDADGATACALLMRGLRSLGAEVDFLVPNRFTYGYGLTPELVDLAVTYQPQLLITVDNGITSIEGVVTANAHGLDVIITDHHLPGATLPSATAILNPNQPGCPFPSKNLAGVGVAFYLLIALRAKLRQQGFFANRPETHLAALLPLVALGTIADLVSLDQLNRTLVQQGLQRIRQQQAACGIAALFQCANRDPQQATTSDLGFFLGPRLNAAGRLADMRLGILCLITDDPAEANSLAQQLNQMNQERRVIETDMQETAIAQALSLIPDSESTEFEPTHYSLSLFHPEWHQGVIGIVAGRLKDRFHRPTWVFAVDKPGILKGSGRSIAGFHLRDALALTAQRIPGTIHRFGGHAMAAGLTLEQSALASFQATFEAVARELLSPCQLNRIIEHDGDLPDTAIDLELVDNLQQMVWGQGFPQPQFTAQFTVVEQRLVGAKHRQLKLKQQHQIFDGILFNCADLLPDRIEAIYQLKREDWNGRSKVRLLIDHWRLPQFIA